MGGEGKSGPQSKSGKGISPEAGGGEETGQF